MSNTTKNNALATFVERARKVLQHEQRTNHQDQAIKPGGLELFVVRWADQASNACKEAGLDPRPIHSFTEYLEGYRRQDPMQRAASLRAALAILNELNSTGQSNTSVAPTSPKRPDTTSTIKSDTRAEKVSQSRPRSAPTDGKAPLATPPASK